MTGSEEAPVLGGLVAEMTVRLGPVGVAGEDFPSALADVIVSEAARQVVELLKRDDLYSGLHSKVERIRLELIRSHLEPLVVAAIDAPLPAGRSGGLMAPPAPQDLGGLIEAEVKRYMTEKVRVSRPGGGYSEVTRLESLVAGFVDRKFDQELRAAVEEGRKLALAAVRDQAAGVIAETMERMAKTAVPR